MDHAIKTPALVELLPQIENVTLVRARLIPYRNKYLIALHVKIKSSCITERELLNEVIYSPKCC